MCGAIPPIHHVFMASTETILFASMISHREIHTSCNYTLHLYIICLHRKKARYIILKWYYPRLCMEWLTKNIKSWVDNRPWNLPFGCEGKGGRSNEKWRLFLDTLWSRKRGVCVCVNLDAGSFTRSASL